MNPTSSRRGRILLIGGGTGDPGLLTVRAIEAISRCDLLFPDQGLELLAEEHATEEQLDQQLLINNPRKLLNTMLTKARDGKVIGRLFRGDGMLGTNAAALALECHQNGIAVEYIAGLPTSLIASGFAGIPLSGMEGGDSYAVYTGPFDAPILGNIHDEEEPTEKHELSKPTPKKKPGINIKRRSKSRAITRDMPRLEISSEPEYWSPDDTFLPFTLGSPSTAKLKVQPASQGRASLKPSPTGFDWSAVAKSADTLVFLNALRSLDELRTGLLLGGRRSNEGVIAILEPGTQRQTAHVSTLEKMVDEFSALKMREPVTLILGDTVDLHPQLDFFVKRPLFGTRCLSLESGPERSRENLLLGDMGADVEPLPIVGGDSLAGISELFNSIADDLRAASYLVFINPLSAQNFFRALDQSSLDLRILSESCEVIVMDGDTESVVKNHSLTATHLEGGYSVTKLLDYLDISMKRERVIIVGPTEPNLAVMSEIRTRGGVGTYLPIYYPAVRTHAVQMLKAKIRCAEVDVLLSSSIQPIRILSERWGKDQLRKLTEDLLLVTHGQHHAREAEGLGVSHVRSCPTHDPQDLLALLIHWRQSNQD